MTQLPVVLSSMNWVFVVLNERYCHAVGIGPEIKLLLRLFR